MAIFLSTGDFKGGKYNIPDAGSISGAVANVQAAIDSYEKPAIYDLLGVTLGDLLIAYKQAGQTPTNLHYNKIIDAFAADDTIGCGVVVTSLGIKEWLKAYVFYEYQKNGLVNTVAGVTNTLAETSNKQTPAGAMRFAESKFNDSLNTVYAIRWYIGQNQSAFPDYNGQRIAVKASIFF